MRVVVINIPRKKPLEAPTIKLTKSKNTKKNVLLDNIVKVANNVTMNDLLNNSLFNKEQIKHKSTTRKVKSSKGKLSKGKSRKIK